LYFKNLREKKIKKKFNKYLITAKFQQSYSKHFSKAESISPCTFSAGTKYYQNNSHNYVPTFVENGINVLGFYLHLFIYL
jgi:hypothetical protein